MRKSNNHWAVVAKSIQWNGSNAVENACTERQRLKCQTLHLCTNSERWKLCTLETIRCTLTKHKFNMLNISSIVFHFFLAQTNTPRRISAPDIDRHRDSLFSFNWHPAHKNHHCHHLTMCGYASIPWHICAERVHNYRNKNSFQKHTNTPACTIAHKRAEKCI